MKTINPLTSPEALRQEAATPTLQHPTLPQAQEQSSAGAGWPTPSTERTVPAAPPSVMPSMPTGSSPPQNFITGSGLAEVKTPLPKGLYIIVALNVVDFLLSLFRSADSNIIFTITVFIDLLACFGLLLRMEFVRKVVVAFAILITILAVIDVVGLLAVQDRVNQSTARYEQAMNRIDQTRLTSSQQAALAGQKSELEALKKKEGTAMKIALANVSIAAVVNVGKVMYLTRPKVRAVFKELQQ